MCRDIFISCKDDGSGNSFAEKLSDDLKKRSHRFYFNPREQRSGHFDERIRSDIDGCRDLLVVLSRDAWTSSWTRA